MDITKDKVLSSLTLIRISMGCNSSKNIYLNLDSGVVNLMTDKGRIDRQAGTTSPNHTSIPKI
jgi:hypothetical protein